MRPKIKPVPGQAPTAHLSGNQPSFHLGALVATPGALSALAGARLSALELLRRHSQGDWGDVGPEDWRSNDRALLDGARLVSHYKYPDFACFVITEADRSSTCILLTNEY